MLWLQSNDEFDRIAEYDHDTGDYAQKSKNALGAEAAPATDGFFEILAGTFVAIYKMDQQLFLRVGSQRLPLHEDIKITVEELSDSERVLTVEAAGVTKATLSYEIDVSRKFAFDPTPGVEDEDFDFGLFVRAIHKSDERKRIIWGAD